MTLTETIQDVASAKYHKIACLLMERAYECASHLGASTIQNVYKDLWISQSKPCWGRIFDSTPTTDQFMRHISIPFLKVDADMLLRLLLFCSHQWQRLKKYGLGIPPP